MRKQSASKHWKWRQLIRRQEAEIKQLRDRVKELEARLSYKHQPVRQRSKGNICRISAHGGYSLALQRNCGHAGNPSLLLTLDLHFTKQIIPKWEILLACSWLLQRRGWMNQHYEYLDSTMEQRPADDQGRLLSFEVNSIRGDGTNTTAAQSSKAHTFEVSTHWTHVSPPRQGTDADDLDNAVAIPDASLDMKFYVHPTRIPDNNWT